MLATARPAKGWSRGLGEPYSSLQSGSCNSITWVISTIPLPKCALIRSWSHSWGWVSDPGTKQLVECYWHLIDMQWKATGNSGKQYPSQEHSDNEHPERWRRAFRGGHWATHCVKLLGLCEFFTLFRTWRNLKLINCWLRNFQLIYTFKLWLSIIT